MTEDQRPIIAKSDDQMSPRWKWQAHRDPYARGDNIGWGSTEDEARQDLAHAEAGHPRGPRPEPVQI